MKTKATSRIFKQTFAWILTFVMMLSILPATQVNAATKPKLSKTKITMTVGQSKKLTVKGISKKQAKRIKWKSSSKKVVTVTKTGKIKARKAGKATITAKVGKKKLKCKVTVKKKSKKSTKKKESNSSSKIMRLNKTILNMDSGAVEQLILHNTTKKVKWSSSDKNIVEVGKYSKTSTNKASIYANAKGIATVTAKVDGKVFKCIVKVDQASTATIRKENEALNLIQNGMSEQEKTLKLTIWTCDHLKRAFTGNGYYWADRSEQSIDCILKGKATQEGYNMFLEDLLERAGLKVKYISDVSSGLCLKVSIDGRWYNLDHYRMDPSGEDSSGHGAWSYTMPFFLFSDNEAYKYHSQYYSKPSKRLEKDNPVANSTRFDFLDMILNKAKKDNPGEFATSSASEYYTPLYTEDSFGNEYNPWVIGTWRNY